MSSTVGTTPASTGGRSRGPQGQEYVLHLSVRGTDAAELAALADTLTAEVATRRPGLSSQASVHPLIPAGASAPIEPVSAPTEVASVPHFQQPASEAHPPRVGSHGGAGLTVDVRARLVWIDNAKVSFTHREFELLVYLMSNSQRVITRSELMREVWQHAVGELGERTVDVHVRRIRRKLGSCRPQISTIRSVGYRFDPGPRTALIDPQPAVAV